MVLVLLIGDFHIPHRTSSIPNKFLKLLVPGKIQQILCTGNLTSPTLYDYLKTVSNDVQLVLGDFDEPLQSPPLHSSPPPARLITHDELTFGLLHGHQIVPQGEILNLQAVARRMNVDVLISGGTGEFEAFEKDGKLFVNPGSATGINDKGIPSFVLMDVQGSNVILYVYQLIDGDVKVEKMDYVKREE